MDYVLCRVFFNGTKKIRFVLFSRSNIHKTNLCHPAALNAKSGFNCRRLWHDQGRMTGDGNQKFLMISFQEPHFQHTKKLLFDGETALRSKTVQQQIMQQCGVQTHAEAGFRRNQAERAIKEVKIRMTVYCQSRGKSL